MPERCVDASVAIKWVVRGEAWRKKAELRGCEFWTADKVFHDAVKAMLSSVKYLPDYP